MLVELCSGSLPWADATSAEELADIKASTPLRRLCSDCPGVIGPAAPCVLVLMRCVWTPHTQLGSDMFGCGSFASWFALQMLFVSCWNTFAVWNLTPQWTTSSCTGCLHLSSHAPPRSRGTKVVHVATADAQRARRPRLRESDPAPPSARRHLHQPKTQTKKSRPRRSQRRVNDLASAPRGVKPKWRRSKTTKTALRCPPGSECVQRQGFFLRRSPRLFGLFLVVWRV